MVLCRVGLSVKMAEWDDKYRTVHRTALFFNTSGQGEKLWM